VVYEYKATITRVIDGDTFDFTIDLGFGLSYRSRLRLYGVDTPEVRGPTKLLGLKVKHWVESKIGGKEVLLQTVKWKGKYGRFIAKVWYTEPSTMVEGMLDRHNLSNVLVSKSMAKEVDY